MIVRFVPAVQVVELCFGFANWSKASCIVFSASCRAIPDRKDESKSQEPSNISGNFQQSFHQDEYTKAGADNWGSATSHFRTSSGSHD